MPDDSSRAFDIILWGATGFTGRLVAEYLADHPDIDDVDWAIAGRNRDKLQELRTELGDEFDDLPIVVADAFDRASLDDLARQTRVVCSTCGPYARLGDDLVAACVEAETDYCDLTGEVHWIRRIIERHHEQAEERGVRLVHCCGFDAIPSDLGISLVQSEAVDRFGNPCPEVRTIVWRIRGGMSGGTAQSFVEVIAEATRDPEVRRAVGAPYSLNPPGEQSGPDTGLQRTPRHDGPTDTWTAPFIMAAVNEKIVRRSNALLDYRYGRDFRYSESMRRGRGLTGALRAGTASAGIGLFTAALTLGPTRSLLQKFVLPDSGEGPDEEARQQGGFTVRLFGRHPDDDGDNRVVCEVGADKDPGYGATSMMIGESALSLAFDDPDDGLDGGVLTPASAFGHTLIDRLEDAGMTFDVVG